MHAWKRPADNWRTFRDPGFDQNAVRDSGKHKVFWQDSGFDCSQGCGISVRQNLSSWCGNFLPVCREIWKSLRPQKKKKNIFTAKANIVAKANESAMWCTCLLLNYSINSTQLTKKITDKKKLPFSLEKKDGIRESDVKKCGKRAWFSRNRCGNEGIRTAPPPSPLTPFHASLPASST